MMDTTFIGMDEPAASIRVKVLRPGTTTDEAGHAVNEPRGVNRPARRLTRPAAGPVLAGDASGPCSFARPYQLQAEGLLCHVSAPALIFHARHQPLGGTLHPVPAARLSVTLRLPHERPPHAGKVGRLRWLSRQRPHGSLCSLPPVSRVSHVGGQYA